MSAPTLTDIELPDIGLPSLSAIGKLIPADEIADVADSVISGVARLLPWNRTRSGWRTTLFVTMASVAAVGVAIAIARRRRNDTAEATVGSDQAPRIHRAA